MSPELTRLRTRFLSAIALAASSGCTATVTGSDASTLDVLSTSDSPAALDAADVVDAPAVGDVPVTPDAPPSCRNQPAARECFTRAQLEHLLRFPGGGPATDAGLAIDAGYAANGCMLPEFARDSCCNSAAAGPWVEGEQCCYWFCPGACCGRALMVNGAPRVAEIVVGGGWSDAAEAPCLDALTTRALADAWCEDAKMEHASIASFARTTLTLLSLGAPASLIEATQRAALDEVDHARRCFTLSSRYAGEPEAAGPMNLRGVSEPLSLEDFAVDTLRAGCVGETLAARAAAEQRELATDPLVRETLTRIAADEARHAELAWRTLAWCVREGGDPVRRALGDAWRAMSGGAMLGPFEGAPDGVSRRAWAAHGRLDAAQREASARETWRELVAPCVGAVLS